MLGAFRGMLLGVSDLQLGTRGPEGRSCSCDLEWHKVYSVITSLILGRGRLFRWP